MKLLAAYREQYRRNLQLALPVVLTQLGQILTQLADTLMVGRFGGADPTPLAAVSFGGSVSFIFLIACIGVALGLTPLIGEHFVRKEQETCSQLLRHAVIFYTLLGTAVATLLNLIQPLLYHLGQDVEVVDAALPYYRMLSYSFPFLLCFFGFKQFLEGAGNTRTVMNITILANLLNVACNWIFIYGHWGAPALGAEGAGLATLLSRILSAALVLLYFKYHPTYAPYLRSFSLRNLSWQPVRRLLTIGLPIAMQMFLESSAFVGTSLMIGWLGKASLSANQIAISLGNCAFMVLLSISSASTIRISHCYGLRNIGELRLATHASYHLVLAWNLLATLAFILFRNDIPRLFTDNEEVIGITAELMFFVALYQLWDGMQNISVGILRGLQDVKIIMPIAFVSYWLINLPGGYLFGITLGMGANGFFLGYSFGLATAALLLIARIRRTINKLEAAQAAD